MNPTPPKQSSDLNGRRRLLQGVPALIVLPGTPVLAANCKLPSGFSVSGNLSRNAGSACSAPAPVPGAWSGMTNSSGGVAVYNGTSVPTTTPFNTLFPGGTTDPLATVLASGNQQDNALFASVRLQAIASGGAGFPDEATVLQMWNATSGGGLYSPTAGASWTRANVVGYLRYLTGQTP